MKRIIIAVAFAALSVPAMADRAAESGEPLFDPQIDRGTTLKRTQLERGLPFEQTQFDRGFLADIADGASSSTTGATGAGRVTTYEQVQVDRGVPPHAIPHEHAVQDPVWSKDHNFIAPAL